MGAAVEKGLVRSQNLVANVQSRPWTLSWQCNCLCNVFDSALLLSLVASRAPFQADINIPIRPSWRLIRRLGVGLHRLKNHFMFDATWRLCRGASHKTHVADNVMPSLSRMKHFCARFSFSLFFSISRVVAELMSDQSPIPFLKHQPYLLGISDVKMRNERFPDWIYEEIQNPNNWNHQTRVCVTFGELRIATTMCA